jgi:hypothetical protein
MSRTRKPRKDVLAGKRDAESQLYRAVRRFVRERGGSLLVIGGIVTIEWPGDAVGKFTVGVHCLGKKPTPLAGEGFNLAVSSASKVRG